jgi:hypothetical protein
MSTDGADARSATGALDAIRDRAEGATLLPRERAHVAVVEAWADGDMLAAGRHLDDLTLEFPADLLALMVGHQIDFFTGNAVNLQNRVSRAVSFWDAADPHFGYLLGMQAFGLEECNRYDLSLAVGQRAVSEHPDDVWAIHAVTHTYEMQGRVPEGLDFLQARESDWSTGNFLNVHNSWHYALFLLEANDTAGALAVYDRVLHHDGSEDVALELLDATGLLWRLSLENVDVGDRWHALSDAWQRSLVPGYYPFNDMHAAMAFVGADQLDRAAELVANLESVARTSDPRVTGSATTASVGLPVCRSIVAFAESRYDNAVEELLAVRDRLFELGGSHAQRDLLARTLLEAAIRARRNDLARALTGERLATRETSTYTWAKHAQIAVATGDDAGRAAAAARSVAIANAARAAVT